VDPVYETTQNDWMLVPDNQKKVGQPNSCESWLRRASANTKTEVAPGERHTPPADGFVAGKTDRLRIDADQYSLGSRIVVAASDVPQVGRTGPVCRRLLPRKVEQVSNFLVIVSDDVQINRSCRNVAVSGSVSDFGERTTTGQTVRTE